VGSTAELSKLLKNQEFKSDWFFCEINILIHKVRNIERKYHL
jgi:hypothetical protein